MNARPLEQVLIRCGICSHHPVIGAYQFTLAGHQHFFVTPRLSQKKADEIHQQVAA